MTARTRVLRLVIWIMVMSVGCGRDADGPSGSGDEHGDVAAADAGFPDEVLEARVGSLERGSTLQVALEHLGVEAADALRLAASIDSVHSVRSLRPGTQVTLMVTPDGRPESAEIWPDEVHGVAVERAGDGWRSRELKRSVERHIRYLSGVLDGSFYESLVAAGGDASLVLMVSDILQWDVDFFLDPRSGDRYSLMVEQWADGRDVIEHGDILAIEYVGQEVTASAYRYDGPDGVRYYRADGTSVQRTLLKSPLNYRRISSHFSHSRRHPILGIFRPHLGVDYAAPVGTPVVSIGDGRVTFAGTRGGFGRAVEIRHNSRLVTHYGHFSRIAKGVRNGAQVKQGQVIGYVGSSGLSTGPHLDFRCKVNGSWVNPLTLERPPAEPLPAAERDGFRERAEAYDIMLRSLPRNGFLTWPEFEACQRDGMAARSGSGGERGAG